MYTEDLMTISKTDDDKFIICIKNQKKSTKGKNSPITMETEMKKFIADTPEDIADLMKKHLPKMKGGMDDDESYEKGYKKGENEE